MPALAGWGRSWGARWRWKHRVKTGRPPHFWLVSRSGAGFQPHLAPRVGCNPRQIPGRATEGCLVLEVSLQMAQAHCLPFRREIQGPHLCSPTGNGHLPRDGYQGRAEEICPGGILGQKVQSSHLYCGYKPGLGPDRSGSGPDTLLGKYYVNVGFDVTSTTWRRSLWSLRQGSGLLKVGIKSHKF